MPAPSDHATSRAPGRTREPGLPQAPEQPIISRHNQHLRRLRAATSGNLRLSEGLVALEGDHLLQEALRSGLPLHSLFLSEDHPLPAGLSSETPLFRVPRELLATALETGSPQGSAALFYPPVHSMATLPSAGAPLFLVAAGLQDPGNLGTLIRSAEAFGATALLTTPGTASPWSGKALRASAGSSFRLPLLAVSLPDLAGLHDSGVTLLAAVAPAHPGARPLAEVDLAAPCALLIGNEGAGLAPDLLALADRHTTIPCTGPVESLNAAVAGSLLLYTAQQARRP